MNFNFKNALKLIGAGWMGISVALPQPSANTNAEDYKPQNIITRDVCIIGGGSTGTYSAIRLREMGKSVVVVEKKDRLGGHTKTYIDPTTQTPVEIGVEVFNDFDLVKNYFAHFNVPLTKAIFPQL